MVKVKSPIEAKSTHKCNQKYDDAMGKITPVGTIEESHKVGDWKVLRVWKVIPCAM